MLSSVVSISHVIRVTKKKKKTSEPLTGFEPTTFRTPVGCSHR